MTKIYEKMLRTAAMDAEAIKLTCRHFLSRVNFCRSIILDQKEFMQLEHNKLCTFRLLITLASAYVPV